MMPDNSRARQWQTVPEIVISCARLRPDLAVLADSANGDLTAAALIDRIMRGAYALRRRGVRHGHFIAVDTVSMSWRQCTLAYLSVVWLGAAAVMVTGEASEREAVDRVGAAVLITAGGRERAAVTSVSFAELMQVGGHADEPAAAPDDLLDIVFTSGTTGLPKPVASTHAQWSGLVRPEIMASRARRVVAHTGIPIAPSGGIHGVMLTHLARGVTSLCGATTADLLEVCRLRPPSEMHLSPYSARAVTGMMRPGEDWAGRVTIIRIAGGPVPAAVAGQLSDRFPRARVISLYGLTEGGAALCVRVVDQRRNQGSIGRPVGGTEVRVVGPDGRELPRGQVGELAVRVAGQASLSYFKDDPLTQEAFRNGWARTGDLGFVAPNGEIRLVGRDREMIFLRGGRLRPEAVEEIMSRHMPPDTEFTVTGLPTRGGFDRIAVFIARRADQPGTAELVRCLDNMRGPFRPALIRIVPKIPRGSFGKPLRRQLTEDLAREGQRSGDPASAG
jgi:acyl-CoA synthetase (AMP-forming)/AMP-acid ligase II